MKKVISLLMLVTIISSCTPGHLNKYKLVVTMYGGNGMESGFSSVFCDSLNMISTKEADVFVDGTKIRLKAEHYLTVSSN